MVNVVCFRNTANSGCLLLYTIETIEIVFLFTEIIWPAQFRPFIYSKIIYMIIKQHA